MTRLIATSDLHIGLTRYGVETPDGNSRVLDFAATLSRFVDNAIDQKVNFAALIGDNFHTRRPGPREMALFTQQIMRLANAEITTLVLPGNHDGPDTVGDPRSHTLAWMRIAGIEHVHVLTKPGVAQFSNGDERLTVASIPYPHRRAFGAGDKTEDVSRAVERVITEYGKIAKTSDGPNVFLGHLSVLTAQLGSEQSMRIGYDVTVRPEVFRDFDYAFLGHIHRAQKVADNVMYVGSPDYHLFADAGQEKAFVLAEFHLDDRVTLSRIPSGARRMWSVELGQAPDGSFPLRAEDWPGVMVELILDATVQRPTTAEQARLRAECLQAGASFVKIDVRNNLPAAVRAGTIRAEDSPATALEAWLAAQEDIPMEPTLTVGKELIAAATTDAA